MTRGDAVVLLSGGQDSTTCLFWARETFDKVHALTIDYDQRHRREIEAARTIAAMAGADSHEVVTIGRIMHGSSPLTDPTQELEQYVDAATMERVIGDRVELTFVPGRNVLFATLAANRAYVRRAPNLVLGICEADGTNYPDCTIAYAQKQEALLSQALAWPDLMISAPLLENSKAATVRMAMRLPGCFKALAYSHTAYDGAYPPLGKDHATVLRAQGFELAGVPDPLIVRAVIEGLIDYPEGTNYDRVREQQPATLDDLVAMVGAQR
jgi:7-cyano-7-deazaguanine synthase